ncbi:MAG: thioredoxin domain-containing protein [Deltaproteobacteria bacterium]|nr:thioredoxin domain-containing protein [Deltaproteobacteria bacterium]
MMTAESRFNALIHEKSPYLLQHAENPVDWYPWGKEAFQKAKNEDKPIFLSVGYATCHWCHVMAHESFEDSGTAEILNNHFVSIKVDREERPDLDKIYMSVCQALTGHGGWPLSVFLTPDKIPFFAGTYFPKTSRQGLIGFSELLLKLLNLWKEDRDRLLTAGDQITEHLEKISRAASTGKSLGIETLEKAGVQLARDFDPQWGGFGNAPKFPSPHQLTFLLRRHRRTGEANDLKMVEKTLQSMRWGGLFDHIGYGFHRYSVDEKWFAPHFEKMLYDQALLAMAYTETYQVTGQSFYARVAREVFTYVLRDMTAPEGGFYSAEDADSEGVEGLFYLWTPNEVQEILDSETGDVFCDFFDIRQGGNFEEGRSIPHMRESLSAFAKGKNMGEKELVLLLQEGREKLFTARKTRIHPLKDDKILTAWNGLMITAFFKGYRALGDAGYLRAAEKALAFILDHMLKKDGYLMRRYREGEAAHAGYLDDYAFLTWALVEGYESTFNPRYLKTAVALTHTLLDLFWDSENGGFFFTGRENETLITRSRDAQDGALPSGNSVAALILLQLGRLTGETAFEEKADKLMRAFSDPVDAYPSAHTQLLQALDFMIGPAQEVVISGSSDDDNTKTMLEVIHRNFFPHQVAHLVSTDEERDRLAGLAPFVKEMVPVEGKATAYVCRRYACRAPVTDPREMEEALSRDTLR